MSADDLDIVADHCHKEAAYRLGVRSTDGHVTIMAGLLMHVIAAGPMSGGLAIAVCGSTAEPASPATVSASAHEPHPLPTVAYCATAAA